MKVVVDGGAFQQGIGGGILNVAVNFLNAATRVDPSFSYALLADPVFGAVRPDLLAKLNVSPDVVYRPVLKRRPPRKRLVTSQIGWQVLVDHEPRSFRESAGSIEVGGDAAPRSIEILTRVARPCDVFEGSDDTRQLGFCFATLAIEEPGRSISYHFDDPRFDAGNNEAEEAHRWTKGRLVVPRAMLPVRGPWRLRLTIPVRILYPLFDGQLDVKLSSLWEETDRLSREASMLDLAADLRRLGADAYLANHFLPVRPTGLPLFSWAYDILPVIRPQFFDRDAIENFHEVVKVLTAADAAFCISRLTRTSIAEHLPVDAARCHVTWIGTSPNIYRRTEAEIESFRGRHSLLGRYMVCVATIEPRKNHVRLAEAYRLLLDEVPDAPTLVVAGIRGWGYQAFFDKVAALGLGDRVRHLEGLDDDEVAALYSGAELCAYPSLFEGFGLPVLEAMRCGIPVVTSRDTSMEEIVENGAALLVDPTSPKAIAKGLQLVLQDQALRKRLLARAAERLPAFDWDAIAGNVLSIMKDRLQ